MIPIVSINNLISIAICLVSFWRLVSTYKENKNPLILDFAKFYLFLTFFFVLFALPGLIVKDGFVIGILFIFTNSFLFISAAYFIRIPLAMLRLTELKSLLFGVCLFFAIYLPVMNIFTFERAEVVSIDNFYDFRTAGPVWLDFLSGGLTGMIVILAVIFFLLEGLKNDNGIMRLKSFLMSIGLVCLLIASSANYIVYNINFSLAIDIFASILAWIGLIIIFGGIVYKRFYFE